MPIDIACFIEIAPFFKEFISQFPMSYNNVLVKWNGFILLTPLAMCNCAIGLHLHLYFPFK